MPTSPRTGTKNVAGNAGGDTLELPWKGPSTRPR